MQTSARLGASLAAVVLALGGAAPSAHAGQPSLDFDQTFNTRNAPATAHFRATYGIGGNSHRLEVWRDRERALKRRTDDALETYVSKDAGDPEWHMAVLDLRQKIRTDIDRTNLYRVGHFVDWFGMAHGLSRPIGPYELRAAAAVPAAGPAIAPCRWFRLSNQGRESNICWSSAMKLPLVIASADGQVQWRVVEADNRPAPRGTFLIDDRGFARNNANEDISTD